MVGYREMKDNSDWHYANLDALLPKYNGRGVVDAITCDVLIGMDIVKLGDLQITNYGQTKFGFRIPSEPSPMQ